MRHSWRKCPIFKQLKQTLHSGEMWLVFFAMRAFLVLRTGCVFVTSSSRIRIKLMLSFLVSWLGSVMYISVVKVYVSAILSPVIAKWLKLNQFFFVSAYGLWNRTFVHIAGVNHRDCVVACAKACICFGYLQFYHIYHICFFCSAVSHSGLSCPWSCFYLVFRYEENCVVFGFDCAACYRCLF